jgi:hypothetical protein
MSLYEFFFPTSAGEFDQRATEALHKTISTRDKRLFCQQRSVLYTLVKKSDWLSDEEYYTPLNSRPIELWPQVPKFEILRTCFKDECNLFQVYNGRNGAEVQLKNAAASDCETHVVNKEYLIVAILLHDYDLLFANFGHSVWEVCETSKSAFYIQEQYVSEMKMILRRPIHKHSDVFGIFQVSLKTKERVSGVATLAGMLDVPEEMTFKKILSGNAVTESQKKLDIESYFAKEKQ